MTRKILFNLICISLLFSTISFTCYAEELQDSTSFYPSYIEEYDELYFLENIYMEKIYYEHYFLQNRDFNRLDLSTNKFAQELRTEIEHIYSMQQSGKIVVTLEHSTDYEYQEYVDIVLNIYIEFIKFYQYQDSVIQPDFTTCSFTPYVNPERPNSYCTDISINYINYK